MMCANTRCLILRRSRTPKCLAVWQTTEKPDRLLLKVHGDCLHGSSALDRRLLPTELEPYRTTVKGAQYSIRSQQPTGKNRTATRAIALAPTASMLLTDSRSSQDSEESETRPHSSTHSSLQRTSLPSIQQQRPSHPSRITPRYEVTTFVHRQNTELLAYNRHAATM